LACAAVVSLRICVLTFDSVCPSQDCIVHTYAACCVERFLTVKDGAAQRVGRVELQPMLQPFLTNLFACLALDSSKENPHIMK
jgi:exportin-2 (importin alpha re-exporter)